MIVKLGVYFFRSWGCCYISRHLSLQASSLGREGTGSRLSRPKENAYVFSTSSPKIDDDDAVVGCGLWVQQCSEHYIELSRNPSLELSKGIKNQVAFL